jgi:hypothetical protein
MVHVIRDKPGNGSHIAVPRPLGLVGVAIPAGAFENSRNFGSPIGVRPIVCAWTTGGFVFSGRMNWMPRTSTTNAMPGHFPILNITLTSISNLFLKNYKPRQ